MGAFKTYVAVMIVMIARAQDWDTAIMISVQQSLKNFAGAALIDA